ncbi:MAG: DUF1080 domain-containing protein [Planctomycetes bacterium]|nr:DUF1080 domain-containing protein [Planctomycetota bacterium]
MIRAKKLKLILLVLFGLLCFLFLASVAGIVSGNSAGGQGDESGGTDSQNLELAQEYYSIGLGAFKDKQYEKARDFAVKAISNNENFVQAHALLGDIFKMLKEEELSGENFKKASELIDRQDSPDEELTRLQKELAAKAEKYLSLDKKVSELDADFIFKLMKLGALSAEEENYLLAEEIFSTVLKINDRDSEAAKELDRINEELSRQSINDNDDKTKKDAEMADVYYQSGLALMKQDKYDEAAEKLNKALSYKRRFPQALFNLGGCYEKLKNNKDAQYNYRFCIKCLQKAGRSKEENELLLQALANLDKIDAYSKQVSGLKSDYVTGALKIARDCLNKKWQRFAYRQIDKVLQVDPDHKPALELKGKIDKNVILAIERERLSSRKINLFNGRDLSNWDFLGNNSNKKCWSAENGKLMACPVPGYDTYMVWNGKRPANFTVKVEFELKKFTGDIDKSLLGVMHTKKPNDNVNMRTFAFYGRGMAIGRNTAEIIVKNGQVASILNGDKTECGFKQEDIPIIGIIIRNMEVCITAITFQGDYSDDESQPAVIPEARKEAENDQPQPLFNGKNLKDWKFPGGPESEKNWTVEKGQIVVRPVQGFDTLLVWKDEPPDNYVLKFEFELAKTIGPPSDARLALITNTFPEDATRLTTLEIKLANANPKVNTAKYVRENAQYKLFVNNMLVYQGKCKDEGISSIGLRVRNLNLSFKVITLQRSDTTNKNNE